MVDNVSPREMVALLELERDSVQGELDSASNKTAVESAERLRKFLVASGSSGVLSVTSSDEVSSLNLRGVGVSSKVLSGIVEFGESELVRNMLGVDEDGVEQGFVYDGTFDEVP